MQNEQDKIIQSQARGDLADSFIKLGHICSLGIQKLENQSFFQHDNRPLMSVLPNEIINISQHLQHLNAIMAGDLASRVDYLTHPNDMHTKYWKVAKILIIRGLDKSACNGEDRSTYNRARQKTKKTIWSIDRAASDTGRCIVEALRAMQLNHAIQEALRIKWRHLDDILHVFAGDNTYTKRKSSSW